jgi:hypothetical protein
VLGMLTTDSHAAATARNILSSEGLYRVGFAIPLLAVGFHIAWALLFYQVGVNDARWTDRARTGRA